MRTDVYSGKHDYVDTCYVGSEEDVRPNLYNLIADSFLKDLFTRAVVLREFVELDWRFRAFSGKLPIAPEVRVMVRDGEVERWFFYWPEDAILLPDRPDWRKLLAEMRRTAERERERFLSVAREVATEFDDYWSVDFARTRDGRWILIDMALGEVSWRPELTGNYTETVPDLKETLDLP
nr:ATP-grasp domain-containing protein [Archaeoglobus neptunius]